MDQLSPDCNCYENRRNSSLDKSSSSTATKPQTLKKENSKSEAMSWLPNDVIMDILCRLPVKTLLRCKSVSKSFYCLIQDSYFIKLQIQHSIRASSGRSLILSGMDMLHRVSLVDLDSLDKAIQLNHPFNKRFGAIVIGSCNGLIALRNCEASMALWNPLTKQRKLLPRYWADVNGFHSVRFFGFGYDEVSDDYKIIVSFRDWKYLRIICYSLKANSWRRIEDFPNYTRKILGELGTLFSGALHWVAMEGRSLVVVAFDLKSEKFFKVLAPDVEDRCDVSLSVLKGCLCLSYNRFAEDCLEVWIMKEYKKEDSWHKWFSVSCKTFSIPLPFASVHALAYLKEEETVLIVQDGNGLYYYDLKRKRTQTLEVDHISFYLWRSMIHVGSLVSPYTNGAMIVEKQ